jgi:c-di-AMP phosphodiesterase-like protein
MITFIKSKRGDADEVSHINHSTREGKSIVSRLHVRNNHNMKQESQSQDRYYIHMQLHSARGCSAAASMNMSRRAHLNKNLFIMRMHVLRRLIYTIIMLVREAIVPLAPLNPGII